MPVLILGLYTGLLSTVVQIVHCTHIHGADEITSE